MYPLLPIRPISDHHLGFESQSYTLYGYSYTQLNILLVRPHHRSQSPLFCGTPSNSPQEKIRAAAANHVIIGEFISNQAKITTVRILT